MRYAAVIYLGVLGAAGVRAQTVAPPTGATATTPAVSTPTIRPTTPSPTRTAPDPSRPVFISGKVMTDDGSPLPSSISIQRVCNGVPRTVAYTDSKGQFNFQWGDTHSIIGDASEGNSAGRAVSSSTEGTGGSNSGGGGFGIGPVSNAMTGCELRAVLSGFRSDSMSLFNRNSMDNPDVGTILLHRLGSNAASVSATSMLAPKDARKDYERGLQSLLRNKNEEAAKEFEKAVAVYPKYADAWTGLGKARILLGSYEPARVALHRALEADSKLVSPLIELGLLAAEEKKWQECSEFLDRALRLNPVDFPKAWYTDAVANFNMKQYDRAEKSVRESIRLDPRHVNPRGDYLLGLVLIAKHDYAGAATELKTYVQLAPNDPDAASVRKEIAQLEKALSQK